ncbi:MAG: hypothetical protein WA943_07370 [Parvibaculum sp.]|uniref:hypothetical protein n=1 Tax=Parvibaculum sp. TaxID=2024848 RepID=UPI003C784FC3
MGIARQVAFAAMLSLCLPAAAEAVALAPNSGAMTLSGIVDTGGGAGGKFFISATLKGGDFTGTMRVSVGGQSFEAALMPSRSYFENGKCYFRAESGRARAEIGGPCDSASIKGRFEAFLPGEGMMGGSAEGQVQLAGGSAPAAAATGVLPKVKLTCAYQDRKIGVGLGKPTEYSLAYSNMVSLVVSPSGKYTAGKSGGQFTRDGDKIRLTSGTWAGAVGTLEADRSGRPAVVFHIEENRRPDGVHIVDPYTTRCTQAR